MLKKVRFILVSVITVFIVFLTSCHKDPSIAPVASTVSLVRSQVADSGYATTFTYDSLGRQIMAQIDTVVTTYTYSPSSVVKTVTLAGETFITTYTTNASGKAVTDSKGYVYTYNSVGYLTSKSFTAVSNFDSVTYTVSGSNVITSVEHQADSATNNYITTNYTYLSTIDSRNFGLAFLSSANVNLISTENIMQVINGSSYNASYTYTYSFDSKGRVTQQTINNGSASYVTTYSY